MGICCSAFNPFLRNIDKKRQRGKFLSVFLQHLPGGIGIIGGSAEDNAFGLFHICFVHSVDGTGLCFYSFYPLHSFENKFGGFFGVSGFRMINNGKLHVFTSFLIDTKACLYYNDRGSVCEVTQKVLRYSICMEQRKRNNY